MVRLDKYLSSLNLISRRDCKKALKQCRVAHQSDEKFVTNPGLQLVDGDTIRVDEQEIEVCEQVTLLLYKPMGYVCSDRDEGGHLSYKNLLDDCIYSSLLHVAGRLDQDTTGLVVCTSDGELMHRIISPKTHHAKIYQVITEKPLSDYDLVRIRQ